MSSSPESVTPVRVLIVEDEALIAEELRERLTRLGMTVVGVADSAESAVQAAAHGRPDLVLMDIRLHGERDGIDTAREIRQRDVPVVFLTAHSDRATVERAKQVAPFGYLLKPFKERELVVAIEMGIHCHSLERKLRQSEQKYATTLRSVGDGVIATDANGHVTYMNPAAEALTGWPAAEARGLAADVVLRVARDADGRETISPVMEARAARETVRYDTTDLFLVSRREEVIPIDECASPIVDTDGQNVGVVIVFRDARARRQMAAQLLHMAQHDVLTELPNRVLLNDRLQRAISFAERHGRRLAVLFVDLDQFKHINDSLGHGIGDQVLQAVATRLERCVRRSDTVSRHGGDEFVAVLSELDAADAAGASVSKLTAALAMPYHIGSHELHVPASVGVSIYPDDGDEPETLISHADTAMYHAKESGRNTYQFFKQEMTARATDRQFIEGSLRVAIQRNELSLHYQPKIDLGSGAIVGVEALVRWRQPQRGFIPPDVFVPMAEETGLILPVGTWVLREACRQSRAWLDAGLPAVPMAVNISAAQFRNADFLESVRAVLKEAGLDPQTLELELTERVLMKHSDATISTLKALKAIGVRLTLDDFGTGYSSLTCLRQFPIDALKVDQSFVHGISSSPDDAAIVSAVIGMGNSLKKRVIAEGVEALEQVAFLKAEGCEEAQGYYFNRPMAADRVATLLRAVA
jgi:diguanylate cyclase (GGDEF)-like protein/PAS domain S-box-containing protein